MTNVPGWYRMHRGWLDNDALGGSREPYCRRAAWVWMIEEARFSAGTKLVGSKTIALTRGQLSASLRFMANAWGWDEAKVRRFIARLIEKKMIDCVTDAGQNRITICNYERFQSGDCVVDAPVDAAPTQTRRGGDANYKKGKKEEEKEDIGLTASPQPSLGSSLIEDPRQVDLEDVVGAPAQPLEARKTAPGVRVTVTDFERFWAVYPRKVGKGAARKLFDRIVRKVPAERLIEAVQQQAWHPEPHLRPHPATWLGRESWDDETGASAPPVRLVQSPVQEASADLFAAPSPPAALSAMSPLEAWLPLADKNSDGTPKVEAGQPIAGRYEIRHAAKMLADAANWTRDRPADYSILAGWLRGGADLHDHILPTVKRMSEALHRQSAGQTAGTLKYFDNAVRTAAGNRMRA